jgi:hypothetical protein
MTGTHAPLFERLYRRLVVMDSGCVEWTGYTTKAGYGAIGTQNKQTEPTHRVAWKLINGPIPEGLDVLHHCDNPPCCNAYDTENHLFLGTDADNTADKVSKNRQARSNLAKTHCPAGHRYNKTNTFTDTKGSRHCRKCDLARHLNPARRGEVLVGTDRTHCANNHPFDEANTYVNPTTGRWACRTCRRDNRRKD